MDMRLLQTAVILSLTSVACNSSHSTDGFDPRNALGGIEYLSDSEPVSAVATGPFVLTDVMLDGHAWQVFTSSDPTCKEHDPGNLFELFESADKPTTLQSHHGMKLFVPAGKTLCFHSSIGQTSLVWAATRIKT